MRKALQHFLLVALWFFGTWLVLSSINFTEILNIEQMTKENERKLGELILDVIRENHEEVEVDSVLKYVVGLKDLICGANNIENSSLTVHIISNENVNAFALPNRHLVVNSGLIGYCSSPEEFTGILAHEIAHIELRHVMQKLVKEVGLMMLMTITGGESGSRIMRGVANTLSSTAFDRKQESEADASAVEYLEHAGIDPEHLASFLFRLSREKGNIPKYFELLSTHPNSSDRAAEILRVRKRQNFNPRPIGGGVEAWKMFQEHVNDISNLNLDD